MKKIALCIGINNYPGTGMDLSGCVNDANDWVRLLQEMGYSTYLMTDRSATLKNMVEQMREFVSAIKKGDRLVITYSGHGTYVPDENHDEVDGVDECLCPHDIMTNGPFTDDEIYNIFKDRAVGSRLTMISDSCHSGTVARFMDFSFTKTKPFKSRFMPPGIFMPKGSLRCIGERRRNFRPKNAGTAIERVINPYILISGCQDNEYSYDAYIGRRYNGAFTYAAVQAFVRGLTYKQWYDAIRAYLPSQDYPQTPKLSGVNKSWKALE